METIRSVLVHVDAGRGTPRRLAFARTLAARFEARLQALFAVAPRFAALPLPFDFGPSPHAPLLDEVDPAHRAKAKAMFDHASQGGGWPMQWREVGNANPIAGFAREALQADLLVMVQRDPVDADAFDVPADFVESVLTASGRPALVLPHAGLLPERLSVVVIGWRPIRDAAQALDGALPLLMAH